MTDDLKFFLVTIPVGRSRGDLRMGVAEAGATRRSRRANERWASEKTAPAPTARRERSRLLPAGADDALVLQENAWDDVGRTAEEQQAAEKIVRAQPVADAERADVCRREAAARWDQHYMENLRNYHDRRWLLNEYPTLLRTAAAAADAAAYRCAAGHELTILETGCGVGNTLLPLLTLGSRVRALGCDHSAFAVGKANERLAREELTGRGQAFIWDIGTPLPADAPVPKGGVDTVLAIFTLSALPPEALPRAFSHLAACLRPGGQLLFRDYGRLDLKQLKFASNPGARLGEGHGCEWYARGDGTTAVFFTTEALSALAAGAGLEIESAGYDRRLVVNRANQLRMHRVWVVGALRKPGTGPAGLRWPRGTRIALASGAVAALVLAVASVVARRR